MDTLRQTKARLRNLGLRPRKELGQHFLVDGSALRHILAAADLGPQDTVVEVGPGLGILTAELCRRTGRVVAVELDQELAQALRNLFSDQANLTIVTGDILDLDPAQLVSPPYKVVANLPYYITAPVLRHFLEAGSKPTLMVVMVQREVGNRILAQPGQMSLLAVSVQFYGRPRLVSRVPARSFYPAPKVDATVLRIEVYPEPPLAEVGATRFFAAARAGFAQPRKQLRNSLAQGLGVVPAQAEGLIRAAGLDPTRRPQTLSLEE